MQQDNVIHRINSVRIVLCFIPYLTLMFKRCIVGRAGRSGLENKVYCALLELKTSDEYEAKNKETKIPRCNYQTENGRLEC